MEESRLFQISVLKPGDSFCDYELFKCQLIVDSAITTMPTVIIYIPYFWIVERLSPDDLAMLKSAAKQKINSNKALESFLENDVWDDFKKNLVRHYQFERQCEVNASGRYIKQSFAKVSIDKKTNLMKSIIKAPSNISVRTGSNKSPSTTVLPPIARSTVKTNKK